MKYTVIWTPSAERGLASIWLAADDRAAVAAAANSLDSMLRRDAQRRGESRGDNLRVLFAAPLGIDFEVIEADRLVYILTVWRTDQRRQA
jgi:plasmid stabilization system protein ParE